MFEKELAQIKNKEHLSDNSPLIYDLQNILDIATNKNYTLTDISEKIDNKELKVKTNPKTLLTYLSQILSGNYNSSKKSNISVYKEAQESYNEYVSLTMYEFQNYSKESYGFNLDASIALKMLLEDGYNIDLIELIIKKYSIVKNINDDYLNSIKEGLINTQNQYGKIMAIDLEKKYSNASDIYRYFIKKYLISSNEKILSSQEELKTITKLYKALIKTYEKDMEQEPSQSDLYNWQKDIETIIIPIIKEILNECSPIATEPGRNKEQYIDSIILRLQDMFLKSNTSVENSILSNDAYTKKILDKQKEMVYGEQYEIINDCMVAKELINSHKNLEAIKKDIAEKSKVANSENNPKGTAENYAHWIVESAKESIDCELNIIDTQLEFKWSEIKSYQELKDHGINAKILYFKALLDRISINPSFIFRLSERETDIDACESIMNQYKDIDMLELKSVLLEYSPRAKLAGIKKKYEERVINAVIERMKLIKRHNDERAALMSEYQKKRGLATEGIHYTIAVSNIKDCKTAVDLFKKNNNPKEVTKIIETSVKDFHIESPKIYANNIVNAAQQMLTRWKFIEEYTPNQITSNVVNDYLLFLKDVYKDSQYPIPEFDIRATKQLIKSGKYTAFDILYTIRDYSPNAVEAGRDSNYKEYVFYSANKSIETKKANNIKTPKKEMNIPPPEHIRVRNLYNE